MDVKPELSGVLMVTVEIEELPAEIPRPALIEPDGQALVLDSAVPDDVVDHGKLLLLEDGHYPCLDVLAGQKGETHDVMKAFTLPGSRGFDHDGETDRAAHKILSCPLPVLLLKEEDRCLVFLVE